MSSSTNNATNTITCDKEGDSNKDTAANQLSLQIEDLSIENEEGASKKYADNIDNVITCVACGKEGEEDSMNICNKCKMVQYCNVACKKKHKSKHKKKCDRQCEIRAVQLHEEALFKPPLPEDCPICMLPLPSTHEEGEVQYQSCCGKVICSFCIDAMDEREGEKLCVFCRTPRARSDRECIERNKKLMEKGNGHAFYMFAGCYAQGSMGIYRIGQRQMNYC